MFNPKARISSRAEHDRLLRERALEEASALFHAHGAVAIAMVSNSLIGGTKDADERRHDRLVIVELERLDRLRRKGPPSTSLVVFRPALFGFARLAALMRRRLSGPR